MGRRQACVSKRWWKQHMLTVTFVFKHVLMMMMMIILTMVMLMMLMMNIMMEAAYAHSHLCFQTYSHVDNDDDYSHDGDADDADDADDAEYDDGSSICSQSPL